MKKNFIIIATLLASLLLITSCKDTFSDINDDEEKTQPRIEFLYTGALYKMNSHEYLLWFYNHKASTAWTQFSASAGGNDDRVGYMNDLTEEFNDAIGVKRQREAIIHERAKNPDLAPIYTYLEAMTAPMTVYMALQATDGSGSIPYSEAGKAYFEGETAFRPKFDNQKELFETWLKELEDCITILSNPVKDAKGNDVAQFRIGAQDFVYGGDAAKWVKFANALRLKIAVRLLHQDMDWAKRIVTEVMKHPLPETAADNFVWNPGSRWTNTGNGLELTSAALKTVEFLVKNQDPRVRFFYGKNQYNADIVNALLKNGNSLPSYIENVIEKGVDADGKAIFKGWKAPGEPWVRYHGVPADVSSKDNAQNMHDYYVAKHREIGSGDQKKAYTPWSSVLEPMLRGSYSFDYPALPGDSPKRDQREKATHFTYMSVAEVNLYLAELKTLGFASIPGDAATYFQTAVASSVQMYDAWAKANKVPYYEESADVETDETIELRDGEIDALLAQPAYQLTGSKAEQLEKIYIQMYINFGLFPRDQLVTARRSGVPMKNSKFLAQELWDSKTGQNMLMPRRFMIKALAPTDELIESRKKAYEEQKFTAGATDPTTLNTERIWYDQGAPNYGEGPNL